VPGSPTPPAPSAANKLRPRPTVRRVIKEDALQSKAWWAPRIVPPKKPPTSCSSSRMTPGSAFQHLRRGHSHTGHGRIAKNGLRYNNIHSTALSSPTPRRAHHGAQSSLCRLRAWSPSNPRASRLQQHHRQGQGHHRRILLDNGYATSWFGKDHNTPAFAASQVGPFDQWPTGMGFEYFYGFVGGDANQWQPNLFRIPPRSIRSRASRNGT